MTLEDRERNFEKALGRELKAKGASGLDCPDTETLAAYHERMLSPEEMAAQKTHIAACPRCQEILATLEVTEAIPSGAEDSEKVVVKSAAPAPAVAAGKSRDLAGLRTKSASVWEMPKRKAYIRWAVPAGAIAAGLLVWIAINSSRPAMMSKQTASVQIAENREQKEAQLGTPQPEAKKPAPSSAPSSAMSDYAAKDERTITKQESDAYAFGSGDRARTLSKAQEETMSRGRASVAPRVYAPGPRQLQNNTQNQAQNQMPYQTQNGQITTQNQATESDKLNEIQSAGKNAAALEQNAARRNEQAMKAPPAAPPPAAAPAAGAGAAGAKPAEAEKRKDEDADLQSATQMVQVTGADGGVSTDEKADKEAFATQKKMKVIGGLAAANLRDASTGGLGLVEAPDGKVLWFITADGTVFRSDDGGKTSRAQKVGDGRKFLAGSAPDAKTCWLLAEKGIVLRTKDGGKKWVTVTAPADGNFTMITGLDAMSALITDAIRGVSYSTTDGGATWKVVPQK